MGDTLEGDALQSVTKLSREVDDIERVFCEFQSVRFFINHACSRKIFLDAYDYGSVRDQDAGNLWYYFHDSSWNKTHFPKSLDWVDVSAFSFGPLLVFIVYVYILVIYFFFLSC